MVEENRKLTLGNIVVILVLGGYCGGSFVSLSFSLFTQSLLSFVKEKKKATNPPPSLGVTPSAVEHRVGGMEWNGLVLLGFDA